MPTSLPINDPVLIFALAMGIFLLAPVLFERFRIPGIVGLILAGTVVGPNVTGLLERDFTFELLGTVGLLYLVFLAALELDLNRFREYRGQSIVFGLLSFTFPMGLSLAIMPLLGYDWSAALLIGAIIGSHTLLAYPVVSRLGILKNPAVVTVVGGTLVTDTLALSVLAVVAGMAVGGGEGAFLLRLFALLALYAAVVLWTVPKVGRWFFKNVPGQAPAEFIFLMVVLFTTAWAADLAGAEPIIGAFLAGLTLNRLIPLNSPLMTRIRFVGNALFIPFFLLSVGMLVDPGVLTSRWEVWVAAGTLILLVHVGKFAGAWTAKSIFGYNREEGFTMAGLSTPQAAATLAVTFVGLEIGLFGEVILNAVIVMILVTVLVGPTVVERFGREIALQEEQRPYDPSEAPRRILIPVSNPSTADSLMDVAFRLRDPATDEPLHPLMVVQATEEGSEAQVAEAEKMLSHAVLYSSAADVPVSPLTRVDPNIATGVARAATETRSSIVVVGWDGTKGSRGAVFGSVLDQLLEQTKQMVVVARMGHPLNTTRRLVVVVPPGSERHAGFAPSLAAIKHMASELEASVLTLVVDDDPDRYHRIYEGLKPPLKGTFEGVEGWGPLLWELRSRLKPEDLVVVMSARRGTVSWNRQLDKLPAQLSNLVPESFLMVHPPEAGSGPEGEVVSTEVLPRALSNERIVFHVPGGDCGQALRAIVEPAFPGDDKRLKEVAERLLANEREFPSEVRPGVALPHSLLPGLEAPLMFLGLSPEGVRFPGASAPVHVIFVLLGPPERRHDHLRLLTRMARTLRKTTDIEPLRTATSLDEVNEWFALMDTATKRPGGGKG